MYKLPLPQCKIPVVGKIQPFILMQFYINNIQFILEENKEISKCLIPKNMYDLLALTMMNTSSTILHILATRYFPSITFYRLDLNIVDILVF